MRYLIIVEMAMTHVISHNYEKIKEDSYASLSLAKTMTFNNVIIFIKSVWNKDKKTTTIIYF